MIMIISIIIAMIISKQGMYRTFKCVCCESCKMMCSYHYGTIELIRGHMIQRSGARMLCSFFYNFCTNLSCCECL